MTFSASKVQSNIQEKNNIKYAYIVVGTNELIAPRMRPWTDCGWFAENISAVLTGDQRGKDRMNVVEQNIGKAVKITQKGHSAV